MTRQYHEERHRIKGVHEISQNLYNIIAENAFTLNQLEKLEAARSAHLWLPLFIFG